MSNAGSRKQPQPVSDDVRLSRDIAICVLAALRISIAADAALAGRPINDPLLELPISARLRAAEKRELIYRIDTRANWLLGSSRVDDFDFPQLADLPYFSHKPPPDVGGGPGVRT